MQGADQGSLTTDEEAEALAAEAADSADRLLFEEAAATEVHESEIRPELVGKAVTRLAADAERGEGTITREDVNRAYQRLALTIAECVEVEMALSARGIAINDEIEESLVPGLNGAKKRPQFLSADQERDLARKIQLANKLQAGQILDKSGFSEKIRMDAEKARELFVATNQRYVWTIVRKNRRAQHLTEDDFYQEGMLGLLRATDLYNPELGFRFKTYATWWIERYIQRAVQNDDRQVRLPVYLSEKLHKIRTAQAKLSLANGKQPDLKTLAEATGLDAERLAKLLWRVQATNLVEGDAETEDGTSVFDFVPDEQSPDQLSIVAHRELCEQISSALASLTPREERILRLRFGIDLGHSETLQMIGDKFGVTRERIRQIEAKALRKLKHPSRSRTLRLHLD